MLDGGKYFCFGILVCVCLSGMFEITEASKESEVAKTVAKRNFKDTNNFQLEGSGACIGSCQSSSQGTIVERKLKHHKSGHFLPVWLIIFIVLLISILIGVGIFLFCRYCVDETRICCKPIIV